MSIDPSAPISKQDQIDAVIRGKIISGTYRPGHRLPTWDALEEQFGVSRLTIMRGMAALHEDGFLTAARSRGTFVVDTPPHLFNYALALPFWAVPGNSLPRFWRQLLAFSEQMKAAGPGRFSKYFGFDWGYSGEELRRLGEDARRHRVAGVIAISHARHPIIANDAIRHAGVPVVAVTAVTANPVGPTVGPDVAKFLVRAVALLKATGRRRVAIIGDFAGPHETGVMETVAALENAGLECRPYWRASIPWGRAEWAGTWAETLFRLPPKDRPEALLVDDEHLYSAAAAGVLNVTKPGEVPIVAHTNFPTDAPAPLGVTRLGFDLPRTLAIAVEVINTVRAGGKPPLLTLLPPLLESEFLAQPAAAT